MKNNPLKNSIDSIMMFEIINLLSFTNIKNELFIKLMLNKNTFLISIVSNWWR